MNNSAIVLQQLETEICFQVDDVETAKDTFPLVNAKSYLEQQGDSSLIAFSHDAEFKIVDQAGNHPFATAVHLAFSQHRPLTITPDSIWMVIAQGFANHINNNAKDLRSKFVRHQDKIKLEAEVLQFGSSSDWSNAVWGNAVAQWSLLIREHIDPKLYQLMICDFSTTTETIHTASQIVMMNAFRQYFDYRLTAICGIPQITLLGTVNDWQIIRDRVMAIAEYNLEWWTNRLLPICDALIATAQGNPSLEFWQHIYKPKEVYGGDVITGWLADLFPYLKDGITHNPTQKNNILSIPRAEITVRDGINLKSLPVGLSETSFILKESGDKKELKLIGGFIGIQQDEQGCLTPEIGWGVKEPDRITQLINRLAAGKSSKLAPDWSEKTFFHEFPKEIIQLSEKLAGTTLYADTDQYWYLRTPSEYLPCRNDNNNRHWTSFIDLKGDRCLAYRLIRRSVGKWHQEHYETWFETWIIIGKPVIVRQKKEIVLVQEKIVLENAKLIAKSVPQFLERILAAEGKYYFDDPAFTPDEDLSSLE
ncbi:MAG: DUF4419 domain-containing protein [Cyanobacteria bacterium J06623_7]